MSSVEDLANALLARSGSEPREKTKILFVECNGPELERYATELEEWLPVEVEAVLLLISAQTPKPRSPVAGCSRG